MYTAEEQRLLYDISKKLLYTPQADLFAEPPAEQVEDLQRVLRYHEWRYYVGNDPVISDFEYDQLYKQLQTIEAAHPQLVTPDSPTQRVGRNPSLGSINHKINSLNR